MECYYYSSMIGHFFMVFVIGYIEVVQLSHSNSSAFQIIFTEQIKYLFIYRKHNNI